MKTSKSNQANSFSQKVKMSKNFQSLDTFRNMVVVGMDISDTLLLNLYLRNIFEIELPTLLTPRSTSYTLKWHIILR